MMAQQVQVLIAKPIPGFAEPGKESYEIIWNIPNWVEVQNSEDLVKCETAVFETGHPSAWFRTQWLVGLEVVDSVKRKRICLPYWKLLAIIGPQSNKLKVKLDTKLWDFEQNKPIIPSIESEELHDIKVEEMANSKYGWEVNVDYSTRDLGCHIDSSGSLQFVLRLTMKTPTMSASEFERYKLERFPKECGEQLGRNLATILNDSETADLKFITSDGMVVLGHKAILKARCPVFAAMLNCDLSEKATGIIKMTDISGKMMKILLYYFYTGELLPSGCDSNSIVELTYAAGKYQIAPLLELLDEMLGRDSGTEASNLDVQLINLAGKLRLEKAEKRLLKRIVEKVKKLTTADELFRLFGYEEEEISEMAAALLNEKGGESLLEILEFLEGESLRFKKGKHLLALVRQQEFRKFEKRMLRRFLRRVDHVKNCDELLDLFGCGKHLGK